MRKTSMLPFLQKKSTSKTFENIDNLQPRKETIDFLLAFASSYHVEKINGANVDFILN